MKWARHVTQWTSRFASWNQGWALPAEVGKMDRQSASQRLRLQQLPGFDTDKHLLAVAFYDKVPGVADREASADCEHLGDCEPQRLAKLKQPPQAWSRNTAHFDSK